MVRPDGVRPVSTQRDTGRGPPPPPRVLRGSGTGLHILFSLRDGALLVVFCVFSIALRDNNNII